MISKLKFKKKFKYTINKKYIITPNKLWVIVLCPKKLNNKKDKILNLLPKKELGWSISGIIDDKSEIKKKFTILIFKLKILNILNKKIIKEIQKIKWFFIYT